MNKKNLTIVALIALQVSLQSDYSRAVPTGGVVSAGQAAITKPTPNTVRVNQSSQKAVIDWQSFNVGKKEGVYYQQPNAKSITLNRINPDNGVSKIYGTIRANGQVWLVNPAGIYFGPSAYVNVSGLVAATANITNADFMVGNYHFLQSPGWNGAVINEGLIEVMNAGLAALVGPGAVNRGRIVATLGTVVLGASNEYTIDFTGDDLIHFAAGNEVKRYATDQNGKPLKSAVENSGKMTANGGKIVMSIKSASNILDNAINMNGIAVANSVSMKNGEIIFSAGSGRVTVSGTVVASGKKANQKGGTVKVLAEEIVVKDKAVIDVSGANGGGTILIGGNVQGRGPEQNAKHVYVGKEAVLLADASRIGHGGNIVVWSDVGTEVYGKLSARGGERGGNGGFIETSGKQYLSVNHIDVNLTAKNGSFGTWLLDPTNIYIALDQASATTAGMSGTDNTANYGTTSFAGFGAIQDSLLTTNTLTTALASANVVVTTTNTSGTGVGNITVVDPISWSSSNTLTLTAANDIAINAAITTGAAGSALILNATGNVTQSAAIGGSGGVTKQGAGTLILSQANTYTGTTTITSGTVEVQHNSGLGSVAAGTTVATGAMIQINGSGLVIAEPISSIIGTGVNAAGALRNIANTNEWSGAIVLGAGGATIQSDAGTLIISGGVTGATRPLTITGAGNTTINSVIGTTTGTLTKTGNGILTLTEANTYSGATAVNAGQVILSGNGTATSTSFSVAGGAKLTLDNSATNQLNRIANALTLTGGEFEMIGNSAANSSESIGTLTLTSGYSTVTVTPNVSFNTQITFASFSRTAGAGVLFRGVNLGANTVSSLTANNSNIIFTAAPTLTGVGGALSGTTTVNILSGAIGDGGATGNVGTGQDFVTYNPTGGSVNGLRPLLASEYAAVPAANVNLKLTANRTADDTFSLNSLLLSGGITYDFDNTAGANTITLGAAALSGNLLSIGGTNVIQTTTAPSGGLAFGTAEAKIFAVSDLVFGSNVPVAGTGSLTKHGAGNLTENRSVAISGGVRITAGTLTAGINSAFSTTQAWTLLPGATWNLAGFNQSITTLTMNSGAISGSTISTGAGTLTLGGTVTLNANGSGAVGASIDGNLALGGTTRTFTIADGLASQDLAISAIISDGVAGITKSGNGRLTLSGANTYSGLTTISAGTLEAANATALGDVSNGTTVSGTLLITNASIGLESITFNNGATISGSGVASLSGNITLGGSAASRTISALLSSDTLTLGGSIDGLAAAIIIGGSGTTTLGGTVGATTALTTFTTNSTSTLAINGGGIRTSGAQTYSGIVNMTTAAGTFEVTGALADILMTNTSNNISQTITYTATGLGTFRDITLANSSASAVVPTLPSGLRNVSLTFTNAGMDLPTLTLTGTLSAITAGGNLTQSGALVITGNTTFGTGAFDGILLNAGNNFSSVSVNGGNDVSIFDTNTVNIGGATTALAGNFSVVSGGTISDSARISTNTLTTSSVGGTAINFVNHTISNFNATNITSGGITLINTVPLMLTGISQTGTTVAITNTGLVSVPDSVTLTSGTTFAITADDVDLNATGAIASGTTTSLTQRLAGGSIGIGLTGGTMSISGSELSRISATGLTFTNSTDGAIVVDGITAGDSANVSGTVSLTATAGTLGTVSFINNSSAFRTLTVAGDAGIAINSNLNTTVGALSLTSASGSISVADGVTATSFTSLAATANDIDLNSSGALTSTTTMAITQNAVGGTIGLGDTAGTMTVSGAELQRISATNLTFTNASDSAITVDGITALNTANISGTLTLAATTGTLGTVSFINNPSSFRNISASGDAGVNVNTDVTTTVGAVSLTSGLGAVTIADGVDVLSATTLSVAANDLNMNSSGTLTSATTMAISQNLTAGSIGIGDTSGTMTVSGSELQRMTATGLTFTNATDGAIIVDNISATNSANISGTVTLTATTGTLGTIAFINNPSSFRTLATTSDNGTNVGVNLDTTVGALTLNVNSAALTIADGATASSAANLTINANDLNMNASGSLTSVGTLGITQNTTGGTIALAGVGTMSVSSSELQRMTAAALNFTTSTNGSITLDGVGVLDTANIAGTLTLTATAGTGAVIAQTASSLFGSPLTISTDTLTVNNGITLATNNQVFLITTSDLVLNATGALSSGTAAMTITQQNIAGLGVFALGNAVGTLTIDNTELEHITAGTLALTAGTSGGVSGTFDIDGVTSAATANIAGVTTVTATAGTLGSVTFLGSDSTFTNGLTVNTDNAITVNDSVTLQTTNAALILTGSSLNLNASGSINTGTGNTTINANTGTFGLGLAAGTMTLSNSALQRITTNNLTLGSSNSGTIDVDGVLAADFANVAGIITLAATNGGTANVIFQNNASSFPNLIANATNTITVNAAVSTITGNLTLNSNTSGVVGSTFLNSDLTSSGLLTLTAPNGAGIILGSNVNLTASGITINDTLDGTFNLAMDAGGGDISFGADVGATNRLGAVSISNVNNVIVGAQFDVGSFTQTSGTGNTAFGTTGIDATGAVSVTTNNVTGVVDVAGLSLLSNFANLSGLVNGFAGSAAISEIVLLNTISAGTHFFDGIDMYNSVPPIPSVTLPTPQATFAAYLSDEPVYVPADAEFDGSVFKDQGACPIKQGMIYTSCGENGAETWAQPVAEAHESVPDNSQQWRAIRYADI